MAASALTLASATLVSFGSTAHADSRGINSGCSSGMLCLFEHDNFKGNVESVHRRTGRCWQVGPNLKRQVSSIENRTGYKVKLFRTSDCTGTYYTAKGNSSDKDLTDNHFDNEAQSYKW